MLEFLSEGQIQVVNGWFKTDTAVQFDIGLGSTELMETIRPRWRNVVY